MIKIGKKTVCWRAWHIKGLATIADLFGEGVFYSDQGLKDWYNLTDKADFWKYLQLQCCVQAMGYNTGQDESVLQSFLTLPNIVQSYSVFYKMAANSLYGKSESLR